MGRRFCRLLIVVYLLVYVAALAAAFVGTRGLFGTNPDGFAAAYLIFLGFPWSFLLALFGSVPDGLGRIAIGLAPLLNAAIVFLLCPKRRRRRYE